MRRSFMQGLFGEFMPAEAIRRSTRRISMEHERQVRDMKERIAELEDWLGEITLINQAMVRVLLHKKVLSREEMAEAIRAIDLLDGVEDGKVTRRAGAAPSKRAASPRPKRRK